MRGPTFESVCRHGYQVLERHKRDADLAGNEWFFEPGYPPSYAAKGRQRLLETLALAASLEPASVLEVAAGDGLLSACLFREGRRVVVNDLRPVPLGRWRDGDRIELLQGDLFELDAAKVGRFQLVLACEVIEHVAHGDQLARRLMEFVEPGGHLLVTTPNGAFVRSHLPTYSQVTDFTALEALQFQPDADGHLYLYTEEELRDVLRSAGATAIDVRYFGSPFIGGALAMRYLPHGPRLFPLYAAGEHLTIRSPLGRRKLCEQMIAIARKPAL
jgi:2-polyprenyl-6-hydroxyphenyl methylase/3-demethylubiquinone-9 3-methyltransferase